MNSIGLVDIGNRLNSSGLRSTRGLPGQRSYIIKPTTGSYSVPEVPTLSCISIVRIFYNSKIFSLYTFATSCIFYRGFVM